VALDLQHAWAVGEVATASNFNAYLGPPPDLIDIDTLPTAISQVNWNTMFVDANTVYNGYKKSTGAQNAEINWDVVLAAGTWTIELTYVTTPDAGIYTVQLSADGSSFTSVGSAPYNASGSTIDAYTGGTGYNTRLTLASITIATTGRYRLKLLMATKNASSTNYFAYLQHVQLRRTA
jgi:hypothetical protein